MEQNPCYKEAGSNPVYEETSQLSTFGKKEFSGGPSSVVSATPKNNKKTCSLVVIAVVLVFHLDISVVVVAVAIFAHTGIDRKSTDASSTAQPIPHKN